MKNKNLFLKNFVNVIICLFLFTTTIVSAVNAEIDLNPPLSAEDEAQFDEILKPLTKIFSFVKYIATAIAVLVLLFAGITLITSQGEPKKRDTAKNMGMYVVGGLLVIWAAPMIVQYVI